MIGNTKQLAQIKGGDIAWGNNGRKWKSTKHKGGTEKVLEVGEIERKKRGESKIESKERESDTSNLMAGIALSCFQCGRSRWPPIMRYKASPTPFLLRLIMQTDITSPVHYKIKTSNFHDLLKRIVNISSFQQNVEMKKSRNDLRTVEQRREEQSNAVGR